MTSLFGNGKDKTDGVNVSRQDDTHKHDESLWPSLGTVTPKKELPVVWREPSWPRCSLCPPAWEIDAAKASKPEVPEKVVRQWPRFSLLPLDREEDAPVQSA